LLNHIVDDEITTVMPDLIRHPGTNKLDYPVKPGNDKEEIATPPERRFAMTTF
jgi:hypothetical protein